MLHTRIAESLASQFRQIAENQPELLAEGFDTRDLKEAKALLEELA